MSRGARWGAAGVAVLVLAIAFPFYWTVVASLTPEERLFQAPSLWPSLTDNPVNVDKTLAEPDAEGDEYIYWPN